jgi:hypothetical protein
MALIRHEALFGGQLSGFAECPRCGAALELGLQIPELRAAFGGVPASSSQGAVLEYGDFACPRCAEAHAVVGKLLERFGDDVRFVFRANPRTGKSYLVLTDVAYYLIFTSFVLFTVTFVEPDDWAHSTGAQLKDEVARVGGILLIMGILHAANVVALPVIGRLLASNKRLDEARRRAQRCTPLGPGTWIVAPSLHPDQGFGRWWQPP